MPAPSKSTRAIWLEIDRGLLKRCTAEAEASGVSRHRWMLAVLEEAATRRFRVQCFHPENLRINGWCYSCKTWIGED